MAVEVDNCKNRNSDPHSYSTSVPFCRNEHMLLTDRHSARVYFGVSSEMSRHAAFFPLLNLNPFSFNGPMTLQPGALALGPAMDVFPE